MWVMKYIQELVTNIKVCLDIIYSTYKDMYNNKQSTNKIQTTTSKGTSVKNEFFRFIICI